MLNDTIIIGIIAAATTIVALFAKLTYSSKCDLFKCCCCEIHRNTLQEIPVQHISNDAQSHPENHV
jgi:hypothetical protein